MSLALDCSAPTCEDAFGVRADPMSAYPRPMLPIRHYLIGRRYQRPQNAAAGRGVAPVDCPRGAARVECRRTASFGDRELTWPAELRSILLRVASRQDSVFG